jgi:A/G-specific adenine glycosylase
MRPARSADPTFARSVIGWQRRHGRHDLPWQDTREAYRVWLSEVMLQQTQVATVSSYYPRFVRRFPDVRSLAAATLDEVLALWSGLGYYGRARNLHACACSIVREHGGVFPTSSRELARLPGIGRSTAAAIAVFCFGERAAILDGNVKRVLSRALGLDADLTRSEPQRALWALAEALLPPRDVAVYTQGLMDLGSTVCLARKPRCDACPLARRCVARAQGDQQAYPAKKRRAHRSHRSNALLLLQHRSNLWLVQRPERGVWACLWSAPEFDSMAALKTLVGTWPGSGRALPHIDHALTHFDWRLEPLHWILPARVAASRLKAIEGLWPAGRWVGLSQALALGLPAPVRRWVEKLMLAQQAALRAAPNPLPRSNGTL